MHFYHRHLADAMPPMGGWGIHTVMIRPIYHWIPQRVRAHIAICYMAFCWLQHLRKRSKMLCDPMSPARIRRELNAVQVSILCRKGVQRILCHAKPRHHRRKIHSVMRWPDLERGSIPEAAGTDAQNRLDQKLKQATV